MSKTYLKSDHFNGGGSMISSWSMAQAYRHLACGAASVELHAEDRHIACKRSCPASTRAGNADRRPGTQTTADQHRASARPTSPQRGFHRSKCRVRVWRAGKCRRRRLDGGHLAISREWTRVAQDRHAGDARRDPLEQLEPFATDYKSELHESGRLAVRPRQTCDQAAPARIGGLDENDRHSAGYF